MAKVLLTFRVMPADENSSLEDIEAKIKSKVYPEKISKEPIAFGLVALLVSKLVEDASGELEKVETELRKIEGVGEVEVVEITRTL
jgi:elongation factor 1-beta